jgi:hypothetical protein
MNAKTDPARFEGDNWMLAWTPNWADPIRQGSTRGQIMVGPWPDRAMWSRAYDLTAGCCDSHYTELTSEGKSRALVGQFLDLALDGFDPAVINREFWKIRQWRDLKIDLLNGRYIAFQPNGEYGPYNP